MCFADENVCFTDEHVCFTDEYVVAAVAFVCEDECVETNMCASKRICQHEYMKTKMCASQTNTSVELVFKFECICINAMYSYHLFVSV